MDVKDLDLSVVVKFIGSPYGFQHCESLINIADLGVNVFVTITLLYIYLDWNECHFISMHDSVSKTYIKQEVHGPKRSCELKISNQ